ncbi:unnamed protein product [Arctia plantaginis]|uniref:Uncharacterized protein n=1 Tax=Arctia plantaginis TaxID=874455 RepID=A0A8S1B401_ARCPL|nr:unnamed protein product [Arctia plantaginis]
MFWSGNYIAVRELNSLLKEENVSLSQVLEADDILQECKADNKELIQFLTKPETLADLITLITEEPPKNVELATQYRYANIACEVLTSHLSMLSDRLSQDATQMNRLCDFINKDPPLNPLLASYFSKTVEMLLEKSPRQDWCLHHIVCLRVLDFFKSRRDFLPNLLRHMSTSAIADIFKFLLKIDDLIKTVMEWLDEHQFLECLIQIICGTYVPEAFPPPPPQEAIPDGVEKAERETPEKPESNHTDEGDSGGVDGDGDKEVCNADSGDSGGKSDDDATQTNTADPPHTQPEGVKDASAVENGARVQAAEAAAEAEAEATRAAARRAAAASDNAAALLCDLIENGCSVVSALQSERGVNTLLQGMFTSPPHARRQALVNGTEVLLALLHYDPPQPEKGSVEEEALRTYAARDSGAVELGVAPHLPLLHQALLHEPAPRAVGLARLQVATLLAQLALSEVEEVATTMLTLGTPGVLLDMFFEYPLNNLLHAQVYTLIKNALTNRVYWTQYARHLVIECDLLTRLMDVFEENKNNKEAGARVVRGACLGHVVLALRECARALAPGALAAHAPPPPPGAPLGRLPRRAAVAAAAPARHAAGNFYEVEIMPDPMGATYDINDTGAPGVIQKVADDGNADDAPEMGGAVSSVADSPDFIADGLGIEDSDKMTKAKSNFLELASQRFDADMWEDSGDEDEYDFYVPGEEVRNVFDQISPWEPDESGGCGGEGWAHFGAAPLTPVDPFAPQTPAAPADPAAPLDPAAPQDPAPPSADDQFADFTPFWSYETQHHDSNSTTELESNLRGVRLDDEPTDERMDEASSVELANNLLTAMSAMSADAIANIVNANLPSSSSPPCAVSAAPSTLATPATPQPPGGAEAPSSEHR